jgi:tetratricopeptide (TPR) repeat protein
MNSRAGFARWMVISGVAATLAVGLGVYMWFSQADRQADFTKKIAAARGYLQLSKNSDALLVLSSVEDIDAPAEFRYLKAITLDRLQRYEPANSEIVRAIAQAPNNPRYKGLELRFRLMARDKSALDQLLVLNRDFASVAAVALFSTYAFQAKAMLLHSTDKSKAAEHHHRRKMQTLDTALTLSADIPELHPELMRFAMRNQRPDQALRLVNGMLKRDPQNLDLRSQKVRILVAVRKPDDAATLALELYEETGKKQVGAEYVASVLAQASHSETNEKMFAELLKDFGRNAVVVTKHAVYLTRHGHLQGAQKQLDEAMQRMKTPEDRETLAFVSISLPLEAKVVELADERLRQYEHYLQDQLLKDYFAARILYLRERHTESVQMMLKIVKSAGTRKDGSQVLAQEALAWVRQILSEKVLREQMDDMLKSAGLAGGPAVKVRVADEQELQSQTPPEGKTPVENPAEPEKQPPADSAAGSVPSPTNP